MTLPSPVTCQRCIALATVRVYGSGHPGKPATGQTPYCDAHWEEGYEAVRDYPTHGWKIIEQVADTLF